MWWGRARVFDHISTVFDVVVNSWFVVGKFPGLLAFTMSDIIQTVSDIIKIISDIVFAISLPVFSMRFTGLQK